MRSGHELGCRHLSLKGQNTRIIDGMTRGVQRNSKGGARMKGRILIKNELFLFSTKCPKGGWGAKVVLKEQKDKCA